MLCRHRVEYVTLWNGLCRSLRIQFFSHRLHLPDSRLGNLVSGNTISRCPVFTRYRETRPNTNLIRQVEKNV
jgi:hypothetical protein